MNKSREFFVVYPAETDTKLANKVLIAKKESIQEGAERFRRDLLHNLSNHLVSVRKAYCLLIDSSIEEHIAQKKHKYDGVEPGHKRNDEEYRKKDMEKSKKWLLIKEPKGSNYCSFFFLALNIHCLSSHCMQSTVHGVMSDDVARFLNLLTTTQFYFFIEMNLLYTLYNLEKGILSLRCWSITKSMESEIVVEDFMNFRTHTSSLSYQRSGGFYHLTISYLVAAKTNMEVVKAEAKLVVKAKLSRVSAAVVHLLREDTKEDI
ncbi:LOW QUALITY PROTEIN: hypothetical protein HID58_076552 [Brassica napus]|uniref:Uncharacterized protein n=1 Tax=Brassica napus TaxID=3708 RepID=A0ABQ7YMT9_BRANA|nr:LOW QUALITY PROTEIN: hypothetical protein HID58_076552 [Brassica napus]